MTQTLAFKTAVSRYSPITVLTTAPHPIGRTAGQILRESRPAVQAVFIVRACVAAGIPFQFSMRAAGVIAGWSMLSMAIYVLNGVTDRTGDRVNRSCRPIATGALLPTTALRVSALLSVAGVTICTAARGWSLPLALAFLALGCAYSVGPALKNSPVGFAVTIGGGAGLTYAAGWVAGGALRPAELGFGVAMAVWVGLACAAKDFSDADGDRLAGRRTWPVLLGGRGAATCLRICALAGSLVMVAAALVVDATLWPAALVIVTGSVALSRSCAASVALGAEPSRSARRRPYRTFMLTQYGANLALVLAGA
jgi:4-hydroxybenzoate polyprenyltransferase